MEVRGKAGQEMSLAALRLTDPYIRSIVDLTSQVALYSYCPGTGQWEKTDVEGTLFVYTRSASPYHGFTIMNRLNMNNLVEPVNKDLEFQLHEPFLLYRNSSLSIYSIWFYDRSDCQRISKLMAEVVRQESERAKNRKSPTTASGASDRPIDILEMLSKAKNEYEKVRRGRNARGATCETPRLTKADSLETTEPPGSSQEKPVQKHLTVEELFGTSLPKEDPPPSKYPETSELLLPPETGGHGLFLPFSCEQSKQPESLIFGSSASDYGHAACTAPVLIPQAAASQPDSRKMQAFPGSLSPAPGLSDAPLGSPCVMHGMRQTGRQPSPLMGQSVSDLGDASRNRQLLPPVVPVGLGKMPNIPHPDADLLHKLKLTPQGEPTPSPPISKANIAPKFPATTSRLATPESFKGTLPKTAPSDGVLPAAPQFVAPTSTAAASVLLSPSVFAQSVQKLPSQDGNARTSSPVPAAGDVLRPNALALSRSQLQETLVHLIKNDSRFVRTVHEVYLQSLAKSFENIQLRSSGKTFGNDLRAAANQTMERGANIHGTLTPKSFRLFKMIIKIVKENPLLLFAAFGSMQEGCS
ncbi:mRNA-decapping enzyme 1A [Spea bombifrons]|uniref:mRNA-decapping enzyme 1A n=1 Tax=Spea bombifrons TaxID=233779 RepID=UPI00234BFA8E|nr:mRNA-decapping enzyme 1A [Spea bombifrons]